MNVDVAKRLIDNLKTTPITHDQRVWLKNGGNVFVISDTNRWDCATSGCACGFLFLEEAKEGMVFDTNRGRIFDNMADRDKYHSFTDTDWPNYFKALKIGKSPTSWGADILGIDYDDADSLFYATEDDTEAIITRLERLIEDYSE
jgi:hypothetical protein